MVGNGLPGLGPAVQIPLSYFMPDKPTFDGLSQLLFPYGEPDSNPFGGVIDAFLPAYGKRLRTALDSPDTNREYAASVMDTARYLSSTGEYETNSPDLEHAKQEISRLMSDAKKAAKMLYFTRALGSFTLPSSPRPEWLAKDKKGRLTTQTRMSEWFYKRKDEVGWDEATNEFFDKFGTDNFLILQPNSRSKQGQYGQDRISSVAGSKWVRNHPELAESLPHTYGLFAPDDEGFNNAAWERLFAQGEREMLTPKQAVLLANDRLAATAYDNARDRGDDPDELRALKRDLFHQFPGYEGPALPKDRTPIYIELEHATTIPAIRRTDAGKGLVKYMKLRRQSLDVQRSGGLTGEGISSAKAMTSNRAWLFEHGEDIAREHPGFRALWDVVLSGEVED
jgi:hypothetical protein